MSYTVNVLSFIISCIKPIVKVFKIYFNLEKAFDKVNHSRLFRENKQC